MKIQSASYFTAPLHGCHVAAALLYIIIIIYNNSSFIFTVDNLQLLHNKLTRRTAHTIEHKKTSLQPNITYRV